MISAASSRSSLRTMHRAFQSDQFDLLEELGTGSFGSVYLAEDKVTGQKVAIKKIDMDNSDDDIEEIQREISILAECNDPHITCYYGSFVSGYKLWILMEYLGGGSCLDLIKSTGQFSEATIALVCREILKGLQYLHENGKIHRDIKAANILVSDSGDVKIADFGVAAQLSSNMSRRNTFVGTPFWMAPEVIGQEDYSFPADVWSLGITAIELAHGTPPLSHLHPMKVLFYIPKNASPRLNETFSPDFQDFVAQSLRKNPHDRAHVNQLLEHPFLKRASKKELVRKVHQLKAMVLPRSVASNDTLYGNNLIPADDSQDDDWDFDTVKASETMATTAANTTPSPVLPQLESSVSSFASPALSSTSSMTKCSSPETPQQASAPSGPYKEKRLTKEVSANVDTVRSLRDSVTDRRSHLVRVFSHAAYKFSDQTLSEIADILSSEPLSLQVENYLIKKIGRVAGDQRGGSGQEKTENFDTVETILLNKWFGETRQNLDELTSESHAHI